MRRHVRGLSGATANSGGCSSPRPYRVLRHEGTERPFTSPLDPAERKRRAVKRGRTALDALDELKVEVLAGTLGPSTLMRLKSVTADLGDASGDPRLDSVLAEIELCVEVETAKMGPPQ